jgi:ferredoxin-like protein FixX
MYKITPPHYCPAWQPVKHSRSQHETSSPDAKQSFQDPLFKYVPCHKCYRLKESSTLQSAEIRCVNCASTWIVTVYRLYRGKGTERFQYLLDSKWYWEIVLHFKTCDHSTGSRVKLPISFTACTETMDEGNYWSGSIASLRHYLPLCVHLVSHNEEL